MPTMKQINYLLMTVLAFFLVLFSLENADPVSINVFPHLTLQLPLVILLLVAVSFGATFAWLFSLWSRMALWVNTRVGYPRSKKEDNILPSSEKKEAGEESGTPEAIVVQASVATETEPKQDPELQVAPNDP